MKHWLVKSEATTYAWADLVRDGRTCWDGVRNYQARNNLAGMRRGDFVLYYHSVGDREVVGIARVEREAYPDPTTADRRWLAVDLEPAEALARPVTLQEIKAHPKLAEVALIRQSRLSVMPVSREEFRVIVALGNSDPTAAVSSSGTRRAQSGSLTRVRKYPASSVRKTRRRAKK